MERLLGCSGKTGMRRAHAVLVVAVVLVLVGLDLFLAGALQVSEEMIVLRSNGVVEVVLRLVVDEGLNEVPLPVEPIPTTIVVDLSGKLIPPLYVNNTLYIPAEAPGEAIVRYLARIDVEGGAAVFTATPRDSAVLVVEPNVVLLSLPANITGYSVEDGVLRIVFTGYTTIRYTLAVQPQQRETSITETVETATGTATTPPPTTPAQTTTPPTATTTATTSPATPVAPPPTTPAATTPTETAEATETAAPVAPPATTVATPTRETVAKGEEGGIDPLLLAIVGGIAATVIAAEILLITRRRRRGGGEEIVVEEPARLDDTDYMILRQIQSAGGEILQSQLQKQLGLPKTTLWRRIRKLESLGYIRVQREGKTNRIILVKSPDQR